MMCKVVLRLIMICGIFTPIILLSADNNLQGCDFETLHNLPTEKQLLKWYAKHRDNVCIETIRDLGFVDINHPRGEQKQTALHRAAKEGRKDCVELLLKVKAHVDIPDSIGNTPLHIAGGDSKIKKNHYACADQAGDCVKLLLAANASVNALNHQNRTPLYCAVTRYNLSQTKCLVEAKAEISKDVLKQAMYLERTVSKDLYLQPRVIFNYLQESFVPKEKLPALLQECEKEMLALQDVKEASNKVSDRHSTLQKKRATIV